VSATRDYGGQPTAAEWERLDRNRGDIQKSRCTACGAEPGKRCKTPKGSSMEVPHATRRQTAIADGNWAPA
jgi:hypothetical protein